MSQPVSYPVIALGMAALLASGCSSGNAAKPATADQLVSAGLAELQKGDKAAALSAFQQAEQKDPNNYYAHYNVGTIYQAQGNTQLALQEYGLALHANPAFVPAMFNAAIIYGADNPQLAITTYRQIIKVQPHAPTAYLNLGLLEAKLHLWAQAGKDLQKALDQDPTLGSAIPKDVFKGESTPTPRPS